MNGHSSIYVGNTHLLRLDGVVDEDGAYVNNATVTLESVVNTKTGVAVTGISTPVTLDYVASSNGRYEATISHNAGFIAGGIYTAEVLAIDSQLRRGRWTETLLAMQRVA